MSKIKSKMVPIVDRRKLIRIGDSIGMTLPLEWFRAHGYGNTPEEIQRKMREIDFLILANNDMRIVNPNHRKKVEKEVYDLVSDKVADADVGVGKNITEEISGE